jgi:hypothetical protein
MRVDPQKVILVGGLASSPYVYKELQDWGQQRGVSVSRPDGPTYAARSSPLGQS